jgi:hypothetical protein
LMSEPMEEPAPTIWLLFTIVLFMVVISIKLPPAAPCTATLPATVSTCPFRFDQLVWRLTWLLLIWLPAPPANAPSFQLPYELVACA